MPGVMTILREAFGRDDEAKLVAALLKDPGAQPCLSLAAWSGDTALGYILFSRATVTGAGQPVKASILAPLAVVPRARGQGIGGRLIARGLKQLARTETELVFVLGYPDYYTRHGFRPATPLGLTAPYPIPAKDADAWMVQPLNTELPASLRGKVRCSETLDKPEYWLE